MVTDRRVLHQSGRLSHQILEIPPSDIRELVPDMGCRILRDRAGQLFDLQDLLLPHDVAQAIIDLTGVPDPRLVSARLRAWDDFGGHFTAGCGVAMVLLLSPGLHEIVGFGADWQSDPKTVLDYALMLMFIPGLMLALLLGKVVGLLILMLAMRLFLSA